MSSADDIAVHVLHVVPGLQAGGMELTMSRLIGRLACRDLRHSIACLTGEPIIRGRFHPSVEIHCLNAKPNEVGLPWRLRRLIRRVAPTVIHARNWGAWPDTALACLLTGLPLVFSFHGLGQMNGMPWRRRVAFRLLPHVTTHLFTLSRGSRRFLIDRYGWPQRCAVIPNGVDTERFEPAPRRPASQRVVIGTIGNLRPIKNHALLIRACAGLEAADVDWELRIAGEGSELSVLTDLVNALRLQDRIQFAGFVQETPAFLQGLDIFALTSNSEQHPNALTEAMACGLPCVATRVGGVPELLDDGRCGRIVEVGDLGGLIAALLEMALSPETRLVLGEAARCRACDQFSMDRMVAAYEGLYRNLSARGAKHRSKGPL